jgi:hypothetical protein
MWGNAMPFSKDGPGVLLASAFDKAFDARAVCRPDGQPGETLLVAVDIGGSHARQLFETYSFLVVNMEHNARWFSAQQSFRAERMRSRRRISFKSLNDRVRRAALPTFLSLGNALQGSLVTFGISRAGASAFRQSDCSEWEADLACWKPSVHERLMRVLHLSGFLLSGVASAGQNILWVIDEDEIAANVSQLTQLTKLFAQVASHSLDRQMGHLRCATAKSDDGTFWLEDCLAYSDLAAGSVCEIMTAMAGRHGLLQPHVIAALPSGLSWKARTIAAWLSAKNSPLQRVTCLIDLNTDGPGMRATMLQWHAFPSMLE